MMERRRASRASRANAVHREAKGGHIDQVSWGEGSTTMEGAGISGLSGKCSTLRGGGRTLCRAVGPTSETHASSSVLGGGGHVEQGGARALIMFKRWGAGISKRWGRAYWNAWGGGHFTKRKGRARTLLQHMYIEECIGGANDGEGRGGHPGKGMQASRALRGGHPGHPKCREDTYI